MAENKEWPAVVRTLHLPGGLRALEVSPGRAHLFPIAQAGRAIEVRIAEFSAFGQVVRNLTGLSAFGCEFARRKEEIEGISPAEWRPVIPREKNEWPTH